MSLRKQGLIGLVFALVAFGGSIAFLAKHAADVESERQYVAAEPCLSAQQANRQCFQIITATVVSKTGGGPNNYNLYLEVPGLGNTSEGLAAGDRAAIYSRLTVGGPVSVKVWHQEVTLVLLGDLRAGTFRNPTYATGDDIRTAVIFAILGGVLTVQSFFMMRSKRRRAGSEVPDPELDRLSGPFGMDTGARLEVTREYRAPLGVVHTSMLAVSVLAGSTASAVRIDASPLSLLIGALAGIVLLSAALWIIRGTSLVVGPTGIALRRPWGQTLTAWSDVISAGPTKRGYVVKSRTGSFARRPTRALNLSPFLQSRANASLPRLLDMYLQRQPPETSTAADHQLVRAGLARRIGAWAIDVLTAVALWFVVAVALTLFARIPGGNRVPSSEGSAIVYIAIGLTVPTYAILCWHAGRTLGLRLFALSVVDAKSGGHLSWGRHLRGSAASWTSTTIRHQLRPME